MTIVLTGGTGYLGGHLCRALVNNGYDVLVLKRANSDVRRLESVLSKVRLCNLEDVDLGAILAKNAVTAIVHAATCYGRKGEPLSEMMEANVSLPLRLMEAAIGAGIDTFINTDTTLPREINAYALSKAHLRDWGKWLCSNTPLRFLNLRLQQFYGPGDDESKFTTMIIRRCLSGADSVALTAGEQKRDFIHITDVVSAYLLLLGRRDSVIQNFEEIDVGTGAAVTVREFAETVRKLSGATIQLKFGAIPYRTAEPMHSVADISTLAALGWCTRVPLADGIRQTIDEERAA